MPDLLIILIGYLLGSIPFGLIITRFYGIRDLRSIGSGNIGATNVWRAAGPFPAILATFFDISKGVVAVLIASYFSGSNLISVEYLELISGGAAILGHMFPVFLLFKGGKGVNTALGVFITLLPYEVLIALIVFIVTVAISRYISLGSLLASWTVFVVVLFEKFIIQTDIHLAYILAALILALMITFAHRSNLRRLFSGEENRFSFHSKIAKEGKSDG